jgi:epoxide hydrolase-like predicted phosphatase
MIKAVVFDCFGVLASEGWIPFRTAHFADDPAKLEQANALLHALITGEIPDDEFQRSIGVLAEVPPAVVGASLHNNVADPAMFAYMQQLKPQYKTAMLSNIGKNRLHEIFSPEQLALLDVLALSSETGFAKPDPRAYQGVAEQLEVRPDECVFIDDLPKYIAGAEAVGMQGIVFTDIAALEAELHDLLSRSAT